eukprot:g24410.t1
MVSSGKAKGNGICFLIRCSDLGKPLLPGPRILYSKMPSLLPAMRVHLRHPDIPHDMDVRNALDEIYTATNTLETKFPKTLYIVAGDFNQANPKWAMPKCHQHNSCTTRGPNILNHCYTAIKDAYHSIPQPQLQEIRSQRCIPLPWLSVPRQWKTVSEAAWDQWTGPCSSEVHSLLKSRRAAFNSDDPDEHRKSKYDLRKAIREAKRHQSPTYFKKATIIPEPKKPHATYQNYYHQVALTSIIRKFFKRLVMAHINASSQSGSNLYNVI